MRALWATLLLVLLLPGPARAHDVRPAYLEIAAGDSGTFAVIWRRPTLGAQVAAIAPVLPADCTATGPRRTEARPDAVTERWSVRCREGLVGRTVSIDGLDQTAIDVLVRVTLPGGATETRVLRPTDPQLTLTGVPDGLEVALQYTRLGIGHILGGIDHLLFVLGLLLLVRGFGPLVKTVTAFTLAHSLTLAAATLGFVHVPQAPVEATIALSILFLATEIAKREAHAQTLTERYPWTIAFSFGLLHGFGFAGALSEVGLPSSAIPIALFTFNVGVEIGQLLFIGAVFALDAARRALKLTLPAWAPRTASYGIGVLAAFWMLQRIARFWT